MIHFSGGEDRVVQNTPLTRDGHALGMQSFNLLNPETAFRLTALNDHLSHYEQQLRALLCLSPLRTLLWVNLARQNIQFMTLTR